MVGPLLEGLGLDLIETYWTPDGNFPDHEPNPLLPENRELIIDAGAGRRAPTSGIAWDGDADRCFFIDDTGRFVDGDFLTALLAESLLRKDDPPGPRRSSTTCAPRGRSRTRSPGPAAARMSTASATPSSRRACARRARCSAARSPGTTTSATSTAPTPARSRRCWCSSCSRATGKRMSRAARALPLASTSSPARSTPRSPTRRRRWRRSPRATPTPRQEHLDGISIDYDDWHFNVRSSNTEPLLRLCLESLVSPEDMERRRDEVLALIRS